MSFLPKYCLSDSPAKKPFDPKMTSVQKYPITEYQPLYFVAESFKDAQEKVQEFSSTLNRPFSVRYNPYTETIEVLDTKDKVLRFAQNVQSDFSTLIDAFKKID